MNALLGVGPIQVDGSVPNDVRTKGIVFRTQTCIILAKLKIDQAFLWFLVPE